MTESSISAMALRETEYFFEDISVNFTDMKRLVTLCNCFKVEDIHMRDIIEDFLCEG